MAYPNVHKFNFVHMSAHSPSIGSSPVAAYVRAPFRAQLMKVAVVAAGTITAADCSIAVAINGVAISGSPFPLPVSGAGAGEVASLVPTANTYVNEDDYISFTPSGASGSNIPATFSAALKAI
jgi:hypothetical protein